jgi:pimeloyl-ACP methyl ester carboxylesterase
MDKRGTGGSSFVDCPPQTGANGTIAGANGFFGADFVTACMGTVDPERLRVNSYDNAARDLGAAIGTVGRAAPGQRRLLMGGSQGTYLIQRYMHYHQGQVDAITLDAPIGPDLFTVVGNAEGIPRVLTYALEQCTLDPGCAAHVKVSGERPTPPPQQHQAARTTAAPTVRSRVRFPCCSH